MLLTICYLRGRHCTFFIYLVFSPIFSPAFIDIRLGNCKLSARRLSAQIASAVADTIALFTAQL